MLLTDNDYPRFYAYSGYCALEYVVLGPGQQPQYVIPVPNCAIRPSRCYNTENELVQALYEVLLRPSPADMVRIAKVKKLLGETHAGNR